jgi:hypothetical protein
LIGAYKARWAKGDRWELISPTTIIVSTGVLVRIAALVHRCLTGGIDASPARCD